MKMRLQTLSESKLFMLSAAFFLPVCAMITVYACVGFYPFGDKSLLTVDLQGQYISFFSCIKQLFEQDADFFYTFGKTIGGR